MQVSDEMVRAAMRAYFQHPGNGLAQDAMRTALEAALAAMWQDISTAPKDGSEVLVYVPRRLGPLYAGASNSTGKQWWSRNLGDLQPTAWMPLPQPPRHKEGHPSPTEPDAAG